MVLQNSQDTVHRFLIPLSEKDLKSDVDELLLIL